MGLDRGLTDEQLIGRRLVPPDAMTRSTSSSRPVNAVCSPRPVSASSADAGSAGIHRGPDVAVGVVGGEHEGVAHDGKGHQDALLLNER
ncbi:MAG: hypothetical protein ABI112_06575 [Terracoccus sp.]